MPPSERCLQKHSAERCLGKTGSRCHVCGGDINTNDDWQADHVLAHSTGGKHAVDNYLAAHAICNRSRWNYDAEEVRWILRLGVWLKTKIETGTPVGQDAGQKFCHDDGRSRRRNQHSATNNPIKSFKLVRNDCPNVGGIAKSGHRIAIGEVIHLN